MTVISSQLLIRGLPWKATKAHVSLFLLSHGLDAREDSIDMLSTKCIAQWDGRLYIAIQTDSAMKAARAIHLDESFQAGISKFMSTRRLIGYLR